MTEQDPARAFLVGLQAEAQAAPRSTPASHEGPVASPVTAANLFRHPDAHPIVLDLALLRRYDLKWLEWDPDALEVILPEDLRASVSEVNFAKIHACRALHLVDTFWQRWEVFTWCTMAFNGIPPDFYTMQVPTVAQCLVAIDTANRIREDVPFSPEVLLFLETVHRHDGVVLWVPPEPPLMGLHPIVPIEGLPSEEELKGILVAFDAGKKTTGNEMLDEQLRRRRVVEDYLEESRTRLRHQLELVRHG